jgi:hypothetical protein
VITIDISLRHHSTEVWFPCRLSDFFTAEAPSSDSQIFHTFDYFFHLDSLGKVGYDFLGVILEARDAHVQLTANSEKHMLRTVRKTVGGALALLCLASTLAIAQGQTMTCTASDGKGNCTVATGADGKAIVIVGDGVQVGDKVNCQNKGYMISCETVVTK